MKINTETDNGVLTVYMEGKLDTGTAPQAEAEIEADVKTARKLVLDFKDLNYLSSAGLRMILMLNKKMQGKDGMTVRNVNDSIMEIFDMTGFNSILQIE